MAMVTELNEQERDKESTTFFFDWVAFQVFCEQRDCFWNLAGPGPCVLPRSLLSELRSRPSKSKGNTKMHASHFELFIICDLSPHVFNTQSV